MNHGCTVTEQQPCRGFKTSSCEAYHATHKELGERTKSGLARATARAAEAAGIAEKPIDVSNTAHLRDLAQSAARIFGWDNGGVTVNANQALVVTAEQLEQIRQLRGTTVYEAPQPETPPRPFEP